MTTTVSPLNHVPGNGSFISLQSCICPTFGPFPPAVQLTLVYEQSQSTAKSLADAGRICDSTLMPWDIIKWTPAYSKLPLCSISLQGPITLAVQRPVLTLCITRCNTKFCIWPQCSVFSIVIIPLHSQMALLTNRNCAARTALRS
jgi:hypothetical protein